MIENRKLSFAKMIKSLVARMIEGQLVRLVFLLGLLFPPQKNLRVTFLVTDIMITIELVNACSVCLFTEC